MPDRAVVDDVCGVTPLPHRGGVMTFKRITLDGMKWWVPCRGDEDPLICFTRESARAFEDAAETKSHNPEVLT